MSADSCRRTCRACSPSAPSGSAIVSKRASCKPTRRDRICAIASPTLWLPWRPTRESGRPSLFDAADEGREPLREPDPRSPSSMARASSLHSCTSCSIALSSRSVVEDIGEYQQRSPSKTKNRFRRKEKKKDASVSLWLPTSGGRIFPIFFFYPARSSW